MPVANVEQKLVKAPEDRLQLGQLGAEIIGGVKRGQRAFGGLGVPFRREPPHEGIEHVPRQPVEMVGAEISVAGAARLSEQLKHAVERRRLDAFEIRQRPRRDARGYLRVQQRGRTFIGFAGAPVESAPAGEKVRAEKLRIGRKVITPTRFVHHDCLPEIAVRMTPLVSPL